MVLVHGTVHVTVHEGRDLKKEDLLGRNDNLVTVHLDEGKIHTTHVDRGRNPEWNWQGSMLAGMNAENVVFKVPSRPKSPGDGRAYQPASCWRDIYPSRMNAHHFIHVVGWSVLTDFTLIREDGMPMLGELLKQKASEGVQVLVMPWDEKMSMQNEKLGKMLHLSNGIMMTHDEDTRRYFEGSAVHCHPVGCQVVESGKGLIGPLAWEVVFSHHQKMVCLDGPCPNGDERRRVLAYMGSIDLCDGRYDTPNHPLFRSLQGAHKNDFHQMNFAKGIDATTGPREPWHDIHSRMEGQIARDLMQNFHERWQKQNSSIADLLFNADHPDFLSREEENCGEGSDNWNVQLYRSIDSEIACLQEGAGGLVPFVGGNGVARQLERTIQNAYIHSIRRANHFLYIENQYFMGSSFGWENSVAGCGNMVPAEIALKVASKIRAGERFTAYILTPIHPEGVPSASATQELLHWQYRTMKFMYKIVDQALQEVGSSDHPCDWLAFFCLGNRETREGGQESSAESEIAQHMQAVRRHMIYIHSKMIIVDDEYIIVGSANINERSMAGYRDSELATGSWQPAHLASREDTPKGDVYGFRARLWAEHLGTYESLFDRPTSLECTREVVRRAHANWAQFLADDVTDMHAHLLPYPLAVNQDGTLGDLDGRPNFPDYPGDCPVPGNAGVAMPNFLTF